MIPLFGASAVFDLHQAGLQLNAIHTALSPSLCRTNILPFSNQLARCAVAEVTAVSGLRRITYIWFQHYGPKLATRCLRFTRRFGPIHLEQIAQLHARLVELRLAVADRTTDDGCDFIMFVTFHVVKNKN